MNPALPMSKIWSYLSRNGPLFTAEAALETLIRPLVRHQRRLVWEARLRAARPAAHRTGNVVAIGPANVASALTPPIRALLEANGAAAEIEGVRRGDLLFLAESGGEPSGYSFVFFDTTQETRRQARILGETPGTPIIGMSFTLPAARGKGVYRGILVEMFGYLKAAGYERAICEVDPANRPSNHASRAAGMEVRRELRDWIVFRRILLQRVTEAGLSRWRLLWIGWPPC